ncbi:MAG: ATP synthase F1 subunit epsilon [Bacteroidia bacterium]|nr:ATP synthase F1 subunit epsilon [Bacteroidia bacterium]
MLHLEILSPTSKIFEGEVSSIVFPGEEGSFGVLPNHAPIISTLKAGKIEWEIQNKKQNIEVTGGVVEVLNNKVSVLVK